MYNPLQMALIRQRTSKGQVTPNQLIASKREVKFGKVVKINKKMTMSITVITVYLLCDSKLGKNATQAAHKICTAFGEDTARERTAQK
jgi:hypothetical protein